MSNEAWDDSLKNSPEQVAACLRGVFHLIPTAQQSLVEEAIIYLERGARLKPASAPLDLNVIHGEFDKMEAYREWKATAGIRPSTEMECTVIEADFSKGTVTLKMAKHFRIGAGRHWLLTDDAYDKLSSAGDPPAIA